MPTIDKDNNLEKCKLNLEEKNNLEEESNLEEKSDLGKNSNLGEEANLEKKSNLEVNKSYIREFINQIKEKMKNMENTEEIWVVDRLEGNVAICENRETRQKREIKIEKLPEDIKEGAVLKYIDGKYSVDLKEEKEIEKRIEEKMKNVWND